MGQRSVGLAELAWESRESPVVWIFSKSQGWICMAITIIVIIYDMYGWCLWLSFIDIYSFYFETKSYVKHYFNN